MATKINGRKVSGNLFRSISEKGIIIIKLINTNLLIFCLILNLISCAELNVIRINVFQSEAWDEHFNCNAQRLVYARVQIS